MATGKLTILRGPATVEGWAFNPKKPATPLRIAVVQSGRILGISIANMYSSEIQEQGAPNAWCAFNVAISAPFRPQAQAGLSLTNYDTNRVLDHVNDLPRQRALLSEYISVEQIIRDDPTNLTDIDTLASYTDLFASFIQSEGEEKFVAAAYAYVLGRAADQTGLDNYTEKLRKKELGPFALLKILANSQEFASRTRFLASPASDGFPFR